jgi:MerR family transcriptional regulator, redox-sensitive transcriptional activator SoxR
MTRLSIGQVARRTGVAPSAIRYYESIGLLPEPNLIHGQRRYSEDVLWRLRLIQRAKRAGFSLPEIDHLLNGFTDESPPATRWTSLANDKLREVDQQIADLEQTRTILTGTLKCQCLTLADCADLVSDGCP